MSKKEKEFRRYRSKLTRQMIFRYVITMLGFWVGFILLVIAAWWACSRKIWYDTDPMWWVLNWVRANLVPISVTVCILVWFGVTCYFMSKPMRYLDEIIFAAERLAQTTEEPIMLPPAMKDVEYEMNLVRSQALKNAMMAKEAEQRKNDLIVYLAHDLKTPLTSVLGYLTLLRDEPELSAGQRAKYLGIALEKAERLEELINEFFDITRFNLTTMVLEKEQVNLSRMLEQITSEFLPILAEKKLSWDLSITKDVLFVCDADKMERVFDNLIRNAVNYSYKDTEISLQLLEEEERIRIVISNHGRTIPKEKLEHIFEQFFRLDAGRSSATGGAGLGLAIAREIIQLHGGDITAQSADEMICFQIILQK